MSNSIVFREKPEVEDAPPRFRALKPLFITALVLYFIFLVLARIPASIAGWAIHNAAPMVWLTSVEGSIWNGRAGSAQVAIGNKTISMGKVNWSLSPLSLLIFKPCVNFDSETEGMIASGYVCASASGQFYAENLSVEAPVTVIQEFLPAEATGNISVQVINAVGVQNAIIALDARFSWQGAAVKQEGTWYTVGDLGGEVKHNSDGGLDGKVFDITGPYGLDLNGSWVPGSENWTIKGTVAPRDNANENVVSLLGTFAEEKDGVYHVVWE